MKSEKIGIFSFFAGAGFLDLGFEKTGFYETLFVNEYHKPFMDIYKESRKSLKINPPKFGHHVCDITEFLTNFNSIWLSKNLEEAKNEHEYVGFIGGPPCPDFSIAGKNKGKEGENGKLSETYVDLICSNKPDFFLFENVKGLYRTKKHREFFDSLKVKLTKAGYYLTENLINSIEFGAPQNRERIILLGFQKNMLTDCGFQMNGSPIIKNFNWEQDYKAQEVFSKPWPNQDVFLENSIIPNPLDIPIELSVEYWFQKNDVLNHPNAKDFFTPRAGLPKFLTIAEGDDLKKSYKRLHRWRYSPTAAYGNNEVHLHPYKARRISAAEALAIQSLPKEFIIPSKTSLSNMFKSIGNGVPYLVGKGLAQSIVNFIFHNPIKDIEVAYEQTNRIELSSVR